MYVRHLHLHGMHEPPAAILEQQLHQHQEKDRPPSPASSPEVDQSNGEADRSSSLTTMEAINGSAREEQQERDVRKSNPRDGFHPKNWRPLWVALFSLLIVAVAVGSALYVQATTAATTEEEAFYLAVIGPMSGRTAYKGLEMVRGAQIYVDQVNESGGIDGKPVRLLVFDDQQRDSSIRDDQQKTYDSVHEQALNVAQNSKSLVVLGHRGSSDSLTGGQVYQHYGIPALSGTATSDEVTRGNDWYFRVIPNNSAEGIFLANYVRRIFQHDTVSIIFDAKNSYSASLAESFEIPFLGLGGNVPYKWNIDASASNVNEQIEAITRDLLRAENGDPGMIFLATDPQESTRIVVSMRRKGMYSPIIGGDSLGNEDFARSFNVYPEEQTQPGFFSNGIYAAAPTIYDIASERAQRFRRTFLDRYNTEPGWAAISYYDAALVAVEAIKKAGVQGNPEDLVTERQKIREVLTSYNRMEASIAGATGRIYFNKDGDAMKPVSIGVFDHQRFIPALTQLQPIVDIKRVANLEEELASGRIQAVAGQYMYRISVIYVGIDFNEIRGLKVSEGLGTYKADFYLWFRYQGEIDASNIVFVNAVGSIDLGEPVAQHDSPEENYRSYRVSGEFRETFDFKDYPFDKQEIGLRMRHASLTRDNLTYVVDLVGMRETTDEAYLNKLVRSDVFDSVSGWELEATEFYQDMTQSETTMGNRQFFGLESHIEYSRFNAIIGIERDKMAFILKNLVPVLILQLIAYICWFIPPTEYLAISGMMLGVTIATSFMWLGMGGQLPGVGYTVALDHAFYIIYLLIAFQLTACLVAWRMSQHKKLVHSIFLMGRAIHPVPFIVGALLTIYAYGEITLPTFAAGTGTMQIEGGDEIVCCATPPPLMPEMHADSTEGVTLSLGSWGVDDMEQMQRILSVFNNEHPGITVQFVPATVSEYEEVLDSQLRNGIAPDLFYLGAFSRGARFSNKGYLETLEDLYLDLENNYVLMAREPWISEEGKTYGVPVVAVAHGIYYNMDLFKELDLRVPTTWEDLLTTAKTIQEAGYTPFANVSGDQLSLTLDVFSTLVPNFIGSRQGRLEYLKGERCFNDKHVVATFEAVRELTEYFPPGHETMTRYDGEQLFLSGKAAMLMGRSSRISYFASEEPPFKWSVFVAPAPEGQHTYLTFQPEFAIGLNAASEHKAEAKVFLEWLMTAEAAELFSNELPGFFALHKKAPIFLENEHASTFLAMKMGRGADVRWTDNLSDGLPDGFSLMRQGAVGVSRGTMTPTQAANHLQAGLAQWFKPAQVCGTSLTEASSPAQ